MTLREQFEVENHSAHPVAATTDGTPIAYENAYHRGRAITLGAFVGQQNYEHPAAMHPLGGLLIQWAGVSEPKLRAPELLELRQMSAPTGRWVFFFNHADKPARVEFERALEKSAASIREIMTGQQVTPEGAAVNLKTDVPAESVRVYRIEF